MRSQCRREAFFGFAIWGQNEIRLAESNYGEVEERRSQTVSGEDSAVNKLGSRNLQAAAGERGDSLYR